MNQETLVRFNIQNLKFATPDGNGGYNAPVAFGTSKKMALQADTSVKKIFGDGRKLVSIVNDKGKTGTITVNNISNLYEIAMGRMIETAHGLAQIKQNKNVPHAIYFETCELKEDGTKIVAKTWLYGVTSSRPSESYDQDTDDINESSFDIAIEIAGTNLLNADETNVVENGNEVLAWQQTVLPGDADYDTYGDAVVLPMLATAE